MNFSSITLEDFLHQAASASPTPGGGAVAALAGALGCSMAAMVANLTVGKPRFAEHEEAMRGALRILLPLVEDLRAAVDDDAGAFSGIADAYRLPRGTEEEKAVREAAVEAALTASMKVPLRVLRCVREAAETLPEVAERGNPNLLSDASVAGSMLVASARSALVNVLANSKSLGTEEAREAEAEGGRIVRHVEEIAERVEAIIAERSRV